MNYDEMTKKEIYELYKKYKASDFKEPSEFLIATDIGINSYPEYADFSKSGFAKTDYYGTVIIEKQSYQNYLKMKKLGFQTKKHYDEANQLGFDNPDQYYEFKNGKYKTKDEYIWVKEKLPKKIVELNKNNKSIEKDSEELFKKEFYGDAFTKMFILLEKKIEESYMCLNREEFPRNISHGECFEKIASKNNNLDKNSFNRWRVLRNRITHDHHRIDKKEAEDGIKFIKLTISELDKNKMMNLK